MKKIIFSIAVFCFTSITVFADPNFHIGIGNGGLNISFWPGRYAPQPPPYRPVPPPGGGGYYPPGGGGYYPPHQPPHYPPPHYPPPCPEPAPNYPPPPPPSYYHTCVITIYNGHIFYGYDNYSSVSALDDAKNRCIYAGEDAQACYQANYNCN